MADFYLGILLGLPLGILLTVIFHRPQWDSRPTRTPRVLKP
jgi:hypothetical protein